MNFRTCVQALRASVVGVSPLPDVLVDEWQNMGFCNIDLHGLFMVLYGLSVIALLPTTFLYGLYVNVLLLTKVASMIIVVTLLPSAFHHG